MESDEEIKVDEATSIFRSYKNIWIPILVFLVGMSVILAVGISQYNQEIQNDIDVFQTLVSTYQGFVSTILGNMISGGKSMQEIYRSNPNLTRSQHLFFGSNIESGISGLQAIGWIVPVTESNRQKFEEDASVFYEKNVTIKNINGLTGNLSIYYPISVIAPSKGNENAVLIDMNSSPIFPSLKKSIDTGDSIVSFGFKLIQDTKGDVGNVVVYPVYDTINGIPPTTIIERREKFLGATTTSFNLQTILVNRMRAVVTRNVGFMIYDNRDNSFIAGMCGDAQVWRICKLDNNAPQNGIRNITVANASWRVELIQLGSLGRYTYFLAFAVGIPFIVVTAVFLAIIMTLSKLQVQEKEKALQAEVENKKSKQTFIHYIFHEIRVPFQTIKLGLSNLRIYLQKNTKALDTWMAVDNSIEHASKILNDMLDVGKMEKGKFTIDKKYVNFMMNLKLILAGYKSTIESKGLQFKVDIDEEMYSRLFKCDIGRISQCLNNYLSNAQKFTVEGSITISIHIIDRVMTEPQIWNVRFAVADSGVGIDSKDQAKLFQPYQQITNASHEIGTGLGLVIVKNIIECHSGRIGFNSKPNVGSTFWFEIPFQVQDIPKDYKEDSSASDLSDIPEFMYNVDVLIVDDNQNNCYAFGEYLKNSGFKHIEYAYNGIDALEKIDQHGIYDMIFMDYNMPKMDGIECAKEIRKRYRKETPTCITMLTGAYLNKKDVQDVGVDHILQKPLNIKILHETMQKISVQFQNRHPKEDPEETTTFVKEKSTTKTI